MINFRYHIVSLAAVFLALAVGIAVGSRYFDGAGLGSDDGEGRTDPAVIAFENGYADKTSGALLNGALSGKTVVIISLPGARASEVSDIATNVRDAGGSVVGEIAFTAKLIDSGNRQFAESVAGEAGGPREQDGYQRVGSTLASALVGGGAIEGQAGAALAAFEKAGLVSSATAPTQRAQLALVIGGPGSASNGQGDIVAALVSALADGGSGAVLAGPSVSSVDGGLLAEARDSSGFSTVDVTDTGAGRVVTVLALAKTAAGNTGSWGSSRSADGAMP